MIKNILKKITRTKIINDLRRSLSLKLYISSNYNEETVKLKVNGTIIKMIGADILIFILCFMLYGFNLYMIFMSIFIITLVNVKLTELMIEDVSEKILYQLPDFINEIKIAYYETNMIDESVYIASNNIPYEVSMKAKEIYKILTSKNVEIEIEKYNRECKNKYLKILTDILYLTKEYGDKIEGTTSNFIKSINYILEEVNMEIIKQKSLKNKLSGLIFMSVFPVLFLNFIEMWSVNNFKELDAFYSSSSGFIVKNIIILVTISISLLILNIKSGGDKYIRKVRLVNDEDYIDKLLKKEKVKKLVNNLIPNKNSKEYKKVILQLEKFKEEKSLHNFIARRLLCFVVSLILILFMIFRINLDIKLTGLIIISEILIAAGLSYLMSYVPYIFMRLKKKMIDLDVKDEIEKFNTIILVLLNYERVSVEMILSYIEKFSSTYTNEIRRCISDYEKGGDISLAVLKDSVESKEFKRIIKNLILCEKNIDIKKAFSYLETDRQFYKDERKQSNEISVDRKVNIAQLISYVPYYALIVLYFVIPMLFTSLMEMKEVLNNLKNI